LLPVWPGIKSRVVSSSPVCILIGNVQGLERKGWGRGKEGGIRGRNANIYKSTDRKRKRKRIKGKKDRGG
jgi:hypothetical protein